MADSDALRMRRSRKHKAGDHSLCKRNCAALKLSAPVAAGVVTDPALELRRLAWRMAEAHRSDPANAILGAELRKTLLELMPKRAEKADDDLTGLYEALSA